MKQPAISRHFATAKHHADQADDFTLPEQVTNAKKTTMGEPPSKNVVAVQKSATKHKRGEFTKKSPARGRAPPAFISSPATKQKSELITATSTKTDKSDKKEKASK